AALLLEGPDGEPPVRRPIELDEARAHVMEKGRRVLGAERIIGVEIALPRQMLAGGLVIVDTPGVGGLGSAHAAGSLAAIALAGDGIFVSGGSPGAGPRALD